MNKRTIVFLDDCPSFILTLREGFFNHHDLATNNNLICFKKVEDLFDFVNSGNKIDHLVVDYHLPTTDGVYVANTLRIKNPKMKVWLYSGMPQKYIYAEELESVDRYINKDKGTRYILDELEKELKALS